MAERQLDVVVVGGASFDHLVRGTRVPVVGETIVGDAISEAPGGKGANAAVAAARLGARVAFVGRIGVDAHGRAILDRLEQEHVDVSRVVADTHEPTGLALILVDHLGRKAIMTSPGANAYLAAADIEAARELFQRAKVVILQLEPDRSAVQAAARLARAASARIVLDASPATTHLPSDLFDVDVIRANAGEASALTGIDVENGVSARDASRWLRERGVGATCISLNGSEVISWNEGELEIPVLPHATVAIDTTGSGDAFVAGIAVGLAEQRSLVDAAWLGAAAAALQSTRLGAQAGLPVRDTVDQLLALIRPT